MKEKKKNNFLLTQNGHFVREVNLNKKCHCNLGKKYKNCCCFTDVSGFFDSQTRQFYCDINEFSNKFETKLEEGKIEEKLSKDSKNSNVEINGLKDQFEKIYI